MNNIRIVGPFPPPFGGVAIHCVRLFEALRTAGFSVSGISLGGIPDGLDPVRKISPVRMLSRAPVHYHTDEGNFRWMLLLTTMWRAVGAKYVVTVHSFRHRGEFDNAYVRKRLRAAFLGAEAIIAISNEVADAVQQELRFTHKRLKVIPSNLPLSIWERDRPLPESVPTVWLNAPVRILANAGAITSYNGKDLYGIDVLLEALQFITRQDVQVCVAVGGVRDAVLADKLIALAARDARVHLLRGHDGPLAPIVAASHIVVRPTRTEGGPSLTVSEAMELGRWTIASDAVPRPAGCLQFRNEDARDFSRALLECITNVQAGTMPSAMQPYSEAFTQLVNLYQRLGFVSTTQTPADV